MELTIPGHKPPGAALLPSPPSTADGEPTSPFWWGARIVGILGLIGIGLLLLVGLPRYYQQIETANRNSAILHGKQIALSIIDHESANKRYPMAYSVDPQGRPLLSWRVHMLPYLQEKLLYNQFHLDEPWDSPHNLALLPKMPVTYQSPGLSLPAGYTCWLAPVSKDTVIVKPEDANPKGRAVPGFRNGDLNVGSALTIVVVEVNSESAVPWTAPLDYDYSPQSSLRQVGGNRRGDTISVWLDGHVTAFDVSVRPEHWRVHFKRAWTPEDLAKFNPYDF